MSFHFLKWGDISFVPPPLFVAKLHSIYRYTITRTCRSRVCQGPDGVNVQTLSRPALIEGWDSIQKILDELATDEEQKPDARN